jgi:hypothetical protein
MTEITFHTKSFLATLDTLASQFDLAGPTLMLETEASGNRFILTAKRKNDNDVRAFGPCTVVGNPVSVEWDRSDLETAIKNGLTESDEHVTLIIPDGL